MPEQGTKGQEVKEFPKGTSMQHVINEDLMFDRHRRLRKTPGLVYEFTKDPALLHQYYVLRNLVFNRSYGVDIGTLEDKFDRAANILIAREGNQVVGGVRMLCSTPKNRQKLSIEKFGVNLEKTLPNLDLANTPHCEISRMAILEEYQNSNITTEMMRIMFEKGHAEGIEYGFSMVPTAVYRLHRVTSRKLGYTCKLIEDIVFPKDIEGADGSNFSVLLFDVVTSFAKRKTSDSKQELTA